MSQDFMFILYIAVSSETTKVTITGFLGVSPDHSRRILLYFTKFTKYIIFYVIKYQLRSSAVSDLSVSFWQLAVR